MDVKDKKILYELSKDSRLAVTNLSKIVGLSKDAVINRMNNLEKEGVIMSYLTVINIKKLGYITHTLFLEFKKFDSEKERETTNYLLNHPYVIWISSPSGRWDLIFDIISRNINDFDEKLAKILENFKANLKKYELVQTVQEFYYGHSYLIGKGVQKIRKKLVEYDLDSNDYKILFELSQNSRLTSTEIATKLKLSHDLVSQRIKKMVSSRYIEQFTLLIDFSKLNLSFYLLQLQFEDVDKKNEAKIVSFLKSKSCVLFLEKKAGIFNFQINVVVRDVAELKYFYVDLRDKFGDLLGSRETILIFEQKTINYLPKGVLLDYNNRRSLKK